MFPKPHQPNPAARNSRVSTAPGTLPIFSIPVTSTSNIGLRAGQQHFPWDKPLRSPDLSSYHDESDHGKIFIPTTNLYHLIPFSQTHRATRLNARFPVRWVIFPLVTNLRSAGRMETPHCAPDKATPAAGDDPGMRSHDRMEIRRHEGRKEVHHGLLGQKYCTATPLTDS